MKLFSSLFFLALLAARCPAESDSDSPSPAAAPGGAKPANAANEVHVAMRDGLRFYPPRLKATPGQELVIQVENEDTTHQTHNMVIVAPGKLKDVVQKSLELGEKGPAKNFVPESPDVLGSTPILNPDETAEIRFKVPKTPGIYPFVCTFPGHGAIMYGAIYAGVPMPPANNDPNLPPTAAATHAPVGGGKRPFVQRIFMPDAGPSSIAVALPEDLNLCWDADQARIRYTWSGAFLDGSAHWGGNGHELAKVLGTIAWRADDEALALRFGSATSSPAPIKFLGYLLKKGLPQFHYKADTTEVFQSLATTPKSAKSPAGIAVTYQIPKAPGPVFITLGKQTTGPVWEYSAGKLDNNTGVLTLSPAEAANFTLTLR